MTDHVEPGATVFTDGWQGYHGLEKLGYVHARRSQRAARARGEPASYCPRCTVSPHWPSGGCWAPTKDRWSPDWPATWMSSCSASTADAPEAAGWSSTGCSNSPLPTSRYATRTLSPPSGPGRCRPRRPRRAGTRRAWIALQRTTPRELPAWVRLNGYISIEMGSRADDFTLENKLGRCGHLFQADRQDGGKR